MLMVVFYVGEERFALPCDSIIEIIPAVPLRKAVQIEQQLPGVLNYGGTPIPVVDFCRLVEGRDSRPFLSTRIMVMTHQSEGDPVQTLGLMAERVTDTLERPLDDFVDSGFNMRSTQYIGGVLNDEQGLIYLVLVDKLFEAIHGVFSKV